MASQGHCRVEVTMKITVNELYLVADAVYHGSTQEMDVGQAEQVADFFEKFAEALEQVEPKRKAFVENRAPQGDWDALLAEEVELPDFNFKDFTALRWKPGHLRLLKKVGLFK